MKLRANERAARVAEPWREKAGSLLHFPFLSLCSTSPSPLLLGLLVVQSRAFLYAIRYPKKGGKLYRLILVCKLCFHAPITGVEGGEFYFVLRKSHQPCLDVVEGSRFFFVTSSGYQ